MAISPIPAATPPAGGALQAERLPDPQSIELLSRLFDAIQNAPGLPADVVALLQRLQPSALRVALHDPGLLESYDHAVWRFMDLMTHQLALCPLGARPRLLGLVRNLVDHVTGGDPRSSSRFDWANDWLAAHHRHALSRAVADAGPEIERLRRAIRDEAATSTAAMPLDLGMLDTVPAELLASTAAPARHGAAAPPARPARPGDHFRVHLQGEWRFLQLLWQDDAGEMWLLQEPASDRHWAMRAPAMDRLRDEGLAHPLRLRSLVRRAAAEVLRAL